MIQVGQRAVPALIIPVVVAALSLTGLAGGAAAAHFTGSSATGDQASAAADGTFQNGLTSAKPRFEPEVGSVDVTPVTSVAPAPTNEISSTETPPELEAQAETTGADVRSASRAPSPPRQPNRPQAPRLRGAPPAAAPAQPGSPAPAPAAPPAPAPAPPQQVDLDLLPLNPQPDVELKQLRVG